MPNLLQGRYLRVLFVTTEMDDFIRVGGLAAVSAALPRALRAFADIRIMLPGYRDVVEQFTHIHVLGHLPAMAEMPACTLGVGGTRDGLPIYILLCPELYDRPGNPYGDESGRDWGDNDIRFGPRFTFFTGFCHRNTAFGADLLAFENCIGYA